MAKVAAVTVPTPLHTDESSVYSFVSYPDLFIDDANIPAVEPK